MTHSVEGQKAKHINWKFEDAGFKRQLYQRLDSMLDAAPTVLLRVNRGTDANRLNDLLTLMSNATLKCVMVIFGMRKPSKFNVQKWNARAKKLNAQYREAVRYWNIARHPRSGPLAKLKSTARAAFSHEMKFLRENEDQLRSQSMF